MRNFIRIRKVPFVWLAIAIIVYGSSCSSSKKFKSADLSSQTIHLIDSVCTLQLQKGHFPGMAIAIEQKGNRIWSKGFGYSNIEKKLPVNPKDDLFRIGSVSKTVTACALARLTEKGEIDLDAPISKYYKACPQDKSALTIRQIGGHLGGIRHYKGMEFFSNIHYTNLTDPLEVFIHDTLLFEPGTKFSYSTYGLTLISAVMEMAVHKPFLDIVRDEVITPLQLTDLKADQRDSTQFHRVSFYEYQNDALLPSPVVDNSNKWAGGGFICSAEDLVRFGFALTDKRYLKEETINTFTQSQVTTKGEKTNYGIGIRSGTDAEGRPWFGHSGGSIGGTSMLLIYPGEDLVVVTLVNMGSADMEDLAWKIGEIVFNNKGK